IMTLVSLASDKDQERSRKRKHRSFLVLLGVFGTALLFGDGVITPAISVLSALEGVKEANDNLHGPLTERQLSILIPAAAVAILFGIFWLQKRGSGKVGMYFGPITLLWFLCIGATGLGALFEHREQLPAVLSSFNPLQAVGFMLEHPALGMIILGAVFLSVTGAEALYADMGHFGQRPIRAGWYFIVFPPGRSPNPSPRSRSPTASTARPTWSTKSTRSSTSPPTGRRSRWSSSRRWRPSSPRRPSSPGRSPRRCRPSS
ncbi:MAG: potassium transporter Kup, partial [Verrucomicrobiota bacterium]